ncbi:hypothetical protein [Magnetococcus sp. PR-3]|uniref:hypothetical protein n=1 Tax=Magnetococcus sp. PR-3 TaxID=3120355 RepID=UPI002FCE3710
MKHISRIALLLLGSVWVGLFHANATSGDALISVDPAVRKYCLQPGGPLGGGSGQVLSQNQIHSDVCQQLYQQEIARLRAKNFQKQHGSQWCRQLRVQIDRLNAQNAPLPGHFKALQQTSHCQQNAKYDLP